MRSGRRVSGVPAGFLTVLVAVWLVVALGFSSLLFLGGSRTIVLAGHDAVVRPALDGYATVDLGPYRPSFRYPTGGPLGARIDLGKTTLASYEQVVERYAAIAGQPRGQVAKVRATMVDLAWDSALRGAALGLLGPAAVLLVGQRRWSELAGSVTVRRGAAVVVTAGLIVVVAALPWDQDDVPVDRPRWQPLAQALSDVTLPAEAQAVEVDNGLMTSGTRRLVESAIDSYRKSLRFYDDLTVQAASLTGLRQPAEGEVVALLVSDRHDNIGMDPVARAIADQGGATFLLDAGDDTSTGSAWEAFSLDSLAQAFEDFEHRFAIAGNHDQGDFVTEYQRQLGFTTLTGEVVDGPEGLRLLGASDPRSSGLGSWRDEGAISSNEQRRRIADVACAHDADGDRIGTLLVHDANSGREALERGCVDLVLAGHLHDQVGPTPVTGSNGSTGYSYTNGTTGGAAYALAIGTKLRRDAEVTLVTYRDGRPVGLQPVVVRTVGDFEVGRYIELSPGTPNGPQDEPGAVR
jgi:predicted phosphodiesterase